MSPEVWRPGLTGEQAPRPRPRGAGLGTKAPSYPPGLACGTAGGEQETLMADYIWTFRVYADLRQIPHTWWAELHEYMTKKYECSVMYRKDRHVQNTRQVTYRLCIRGYEVCQASEEVLDKLCTEHRVLVRPWDVDRVPSIGEVRCSREQKESRRQEWDQALHAAFLRSAPSAYEAMLGEVGVSTATVESLVATVPEHRAHAGFDRCEQVPHHDEAQESQPQPLAEQTRGEGRGLLVASRQAGGRAPGSAGVL